MCPVNQIANEAKKTNQCYIFSISSESNNNRPPQGKHQESNTVAISKEYRGQRLLTTQKQLPKNTPKPSADWKDSRSNLRRESREPIRRQPVREGGAGIAAEKETNTHLDTKDKDKQHKTGNTEKAEHKYGQGRNRWVDDRRAKIRPGLQKNSRRTWLCVDGWRLFTGSGAADVGADCCNNTAAVSVWSCCSSASPELPHETFIGGPVAWTSSSSAISCPRVINTLSRADTSAKHLPRGPRQRSTPVCLHLRWLRGSNTLNYFTIILTPALLLCSLFALAHGCHTHLKDENILFFQVRPTCRG